MTSERFKLMELESNQALIDLIENTLQLYLDTKADNFFYDDLKDAWKNDSVGGKRAELNARIDLSKQIAPADFASFKKDRSMEIQQQLQSKQLSQRQRASLVYEQALLQKANSFVEFGNSMGIYEKYQSSLEKREVSSDLSAMVKDGLTGVLAPGAVLLGTGLSINEAESHFASTKILESMGKKSDLKPITVSDYLFATMKDFTAQNNNNKQFNWTLEKVDEFVRSRYEMMQSISYALAAHKPLPDKLAGHSGAADMLATIKQGIKNYVENEDKSWYIPKRVLEERNDTLAYKNIYEHLHKTKGMIDAYTDAVEAIKRSPEWPKIRAYQMAKAASKNNKLEKVAWKKPENIMAYLRMNGHIPSLKAATLYSVSNDTTMVGSKIIPSLNELNEAEAMYKYMAQCVNDYTAYARKHPAEIEMLVQKADPQEEIFLPNYADTAKISTTSNKKLYNLAERMLSKENYKEGLHATVTTVVGTGLFFIPGVGLVAGMGGAMAVGALDGLLLEYEKDNQTDVWIDAGDTLFAQAVTYTKNLNVMKECQELFEKSIAEEKQALKKAKTMLNDDFDDAIEYAIAHSSDQARGMYEKIKRCRELEKMPPEELDSYLKKHKEKVKAAGEYVPRALREEMDLIKVFESGRYMFGSQQLEAIYSGDKYIPTLREKLYSHYNTSESRYLQKTASALDRRDSAVCEVMMRRQLLDQWRMHGKPSAQQQADKQTSVAKTESVQVNKPNVQPKTTQKATQEELEAFYDEWEKETTGQSSHLTHSLSSAETTDIASSSSEVKKNARNSWQSVSEKEVDKSSDNKFYNR